MSFVTRVIRNNSDVISISGDHKYWSGPDEMATVMEPVLPYSLKLPGLMSKEKIQSKLDPPRSWSYGCNRFVNHYISTEKDYNLKDANTFLKVISTALFRFGPEKIFVDKSQIYSLKIKLIQKILGDKVYFVHITRNPLVSCYRASIGKAGDLERYSKYLNFEDLVDLSTEHWNNVAKEISKSIKPSSNYLKLKIEDILTNPSVEFKKICDFLEISFDSNMLPKPDDKIPAYSKFEDRWFPIRKDINSIYLNKMGRDIKQMILSRLNAKLVRDQKYKL